MFKKTGVFLSMLAILLTGCADNSQNIHYPDSDVISNPFNENATGNVKPAITQASFEIGVKSNDANFADNNILQMPLVLTGSEGCENVGVKLFIDGILQEFSPDNSEDYSFNNTLSVKTDDIPYALKIKAKFDKNIETHTISAVSVYNPDFVPQPGMSLGNNHKGAAGGFCVLPTTDTQLDFLDSKVVLKAPAPTPITNEQMEKYNLKSENSEAFLLVQNDDKNTYSLDENGNSVSLQFVAGTQTAGKEEYRVSFYKNHELTSFNGDNLYLDISSEGGKISVSDIIIDNVQAGDFLYCVIVPTSSFNEFAYAKKTDTIVAVDAE